MAAAVDLVAAKDALLLLGAAGVIVPLAKRIGVNPVLGFLGTGILLGPSGLGALTPILPALDWVTIDNRDTLAAIAEFGVVFLLFVIGLELSLERLMTIRRLVFGLGGLQVLVSTIVIAALARTVLPDATAALVVGACLSLSSTAIVIELLASEKRMASATGRASFAVLLFQDLAVVPILLFVGIATAQAGASLPLTLLTTLVQAGITIGVIILAGRYLLRPLFRLAAGPDDRDLFIATTLLVAVGAGVIAAFAGLSMALGAFIAGLLLAETEYRRAIEATIEPFKSLLLGMFFFAVGMSVDLAAVMRDPVTILAAVAVVIIVKMLLLLGLARLFGVSWPAAIETASLLGPAGEFAFVVASLALAKGMLSPKDTGVLVTVAALSMALIPLMGFVGRGLGRKVAARTAVPVVAEPPPEDHQARAILVGYGRVGRLVGEMLEVHKVPWLAVDADARGVSRWRETNRNVYWGDATNAAFLERCGLAEATALIITIDTTKSIEAVIAAARASRPDVKIIARARDEDHARQLYALGVADAVPETIEASLQLSEAALEGLGVATGPVIASIHARRDTFRASLQTAAGRPTRALKMPRRGPGARGGP
ncbi:MAG: cation:proton antiporter [Labrys sp. (in: a-proteobacteria)]